MCDATGGVTNIPVDYRRNGHRFDVRGRFDVAEVFAGLAAEDTDIRLRLRLVWSNASWETTLHRPKAQRAPFEINYTANDSLLLSRPERPANA